MGKKIVVISGFSNSGKDTIAKKMKDFGFHFVVPYTTRPIRDGEKNGEQYTFVSEKDFLANIKKKKFVSYRKYDTLVNNVEAVWYYGVHNDSLVNDINIVILDVDGAIEYKNKFGNDCITFFLKSDIETRKERNIARGDYDETEFERRNKDDLSRYPESLIEEKIDCIIDSRENVNKVFNKILEKVEQYVI